MLLLLCLLVLAQWTKLALIGDWVKGRVVRMENGNWTLDGEREVVTVGDGDFVGWERKEE